MPRFGFHIYLTSYMQLLVFMHKILTSKPQILCKRLIHIGISNRFFADSILYQGSAGLLIMQQYRVMH